MKIVVKNIGGYGKLILETETTKEKLIEDIITQTTILIKSLRPLIDKKLNPYNENLQQMHFSRLELLESRLNELVKLRDMEK